jgi:hypothetical protein
MEGSRLGRFALLDEILTVSVHLEMKRPCSFRGSPLLRTHHGIRPVVLLGEIKPRDSGLLHELKFVLLARGYLLPLRFGVLTYYTIIDIIVRGQARSRGI